MNTDIPKKDAITVGKYALGVVGLALYVALAYWLTYWLTSLNEPSVTSLSEYREYLRYNDDIGFPLMLCVGLPIIIGAIYGVVVGVIRLKERYFGKAVSR